MHALNTRLDPKAHTTRCPIAYKNTESKLIDYKMWCIPTFHKSSVCLIWLHYSQKIMVWWSFDKISDSPLKYHLHRPLFNNYSITVGGKPISFPCWLEKGINIQLDVLPDKNSELSRI